MPSSSYEIRVCENPNCGLRYPLVEGHPFGTRCPRCLGATHAVRKKSLWEEHVVPEREKQPLANFQLHALLDNVRSAWNVGAIFRTADGLGVEKLYLCGITPTPESEAVQKTSLGAEQSVGWEYARDAVQLAERLKAEGKVLLGLEQDERAVRLEIANPAAKAELTQVLGTGTSRDIVLVVGNEVTGVDPDLLALCEQVVYIPMRGKKRSLNVEVAFAIAAWTLYQCYSECR
ncbi:MAG: RNA methyltransferase [Anaerolineae bacterium]|nr:MAG: RNA methyltransferase [Anaerolineae bacterium]